MTGASYAPTTRFTTEGKTATLAFWLVYGYCASLPAAKEILMITFIPANRVRPELLLHKGLKEVDFNSVGIRLDAGLSRWDGKRGKLQKVCLLNPEARWYMLCNKRFYMDASGN